MTRPVCQGLAGLATARQGLEGLPCRGTGHRPTTWRAPLPAHPSPGGESKAAMPSRASLSPQHRTAARKAAAGGASRSVTQSGRRSAGLPATGRRGPRQMPARRQRRSPHQWRGQDAESAASRQSVSCSRLSDAGRLSVCDAVMGTAPATVPTRRVASVVWLSSQWPGPAGIGRGAGAASSVSVFNGTFRHPVRCLLPGNCGFSARTGAFSRATAHRQAPGRCERPARQRLYDQSPVPLCATQARPCCQEPGGKPFSAGPLACDMRRYRQTRAPVPPRRQRTPVYPRRDTRIIGRLRRAGTFRGDIFRRGRA